MREAQPIEPIAIAQQVDAYVTGAIEDAHRYENSELLDENGIYGLHVLAARIYAQGFADGEATQSWKHSAQRSRERDAAARARNTGDSGEGRGGEQS